MRQIRQHLGLVMLAFIVGCASIQTNAGKLLATTAMTVDASMKGWAVWVAKGQAAPDEETVVKAAYEKYQTAMAIASNAYAVLVATKDQTAWTQAAATLTANAGNLTKLITQFQTK